MEASIPVRQPKMICSRIGLGLFLLLLTWQASGYGLQALVVAYFPALDANPWTALVLNDIALYALGLPAFWLVLRNIPDGAEPAREKLVMNPGRYILLLLFCFGALYASSFATTALITVLDSIKEVFGIGGLVEASSPVAGGSLLRNFVMIACVPAVGEEFIFRYLIRKKMRGSGDKAYILVSAACFGIFHANLSQIFFAFAVGAAFAWIYTQTDNLLYSMSLHFFVNLASVLFSELLPAVLDEDALEKLLGTALLLILWVLLAILAGIIIFFVSLRRVRASLAPPAEPGWPYKPRRIHRSAQQPYYGYAPAVPYGQAAYGAGSAPGYGNHYSAGAGGYYPAPAAPSYPTESAPPYQACSNSFASNSTFYPGNNGVAPNPVGASPVANGHAPPQGQPVFTAQETLPEGFGVHHAGGQTANRQQSENTNSNIGYLNYSSKYYPSSNSSSAAIDSTASAATAPAPQTAASPPAFSYMPSPGSAAQPPYGYMPPRQTAAPQPSDYGRAPYSPAGVPPVQQNYPAYAAHQQTAPPVYFPPGAQSPPFYGQTTAWYGAPPYQQAYGNPAYPSYGSAYAPAPTQLQPVYSSVWETPLWPTLGVMRVCFLNAGMLLYFSLGFAITMVIQMFIL